MAYLIKQALTKALPDSFDFSKLRSVGVDGASSNTGQHKGLVAWLERMGSARPTKLLATHCFGHVLALNVKHAAQSVDYIKDGFAPALLQAHLFIRNSSCRKTELMQICKELELDELAIKKAVYTRWLSHGAACESMRRALLPLMETMSSAAQKVYATERADILGWLNSIKSYKFVALVYVMCDILPVVNMFPRTYACHASIGRAAVC